jgi:hypothetical protein
MRAALNDASVFWFEIHGLWNFPIQKWQKPYRHGIEHSLGHLELISDDVEVVPSSGARCTKVQWKPRSS